MAQFVIRKWNFYLDGVPLGQSRNAASQFLLSGKRVDVTDAEQTEGIAYSEELAVIPSFTVELFNVNYDFVFGTLFSGRFDGDTSGAQRNYKIGERSNILTDSINQRRLLIHPTGVSLSTTDNDILFPLSYPQIDEVAIVSDKENAGTISITFQADKDAAGVYAIIGNWDISSSTPLYVAITTTRIAEEPVVQPAAMTLPLGGRQQLNFVAAFGTTSTVTAAINEGAGYAATITSLAFDGLSSDSAFVEGQTIVIGTEYIFILSVSYSSVSAGTLTVARGLGDSAAASMIDDAVITLIQDVSYEDRLVSATLASDTEATATFGDVYPGEDDTRKGIVAALANGTTNLSGVFGSKTSKDLALTVASAT